MSSHITPAVPEGYLRNAAGHLVPRDQVREQDLLRDQVATALINDALFLHEQLKAFKRRALHDIADLVRIAGERYDVQIGGEKGNVTITSYDGQYKVQRAVAERITFTEELEAAKALINACIDRWSQGANQNIRALVDRAFRTDTQGQIKTAAVLELLRLDIDDDEWQRGMLAIRDSIQSAGSSTYVRFYQRIGMTDQYVAIPLDMAGV
jgi:hypothetical protein